jgi:hypothetical protein
MSFAVEITRGVTISCISFRNYENCSICIKKYVYKVLHLWISRKKLLRKVKNFYWEFKKSQFCLSVRSHRILCFLEGVGVAAWLSLLPRRLGVGVFTAAAPPAADTPPTGVDTVEPLEGDRVDPRGSQSGSTWVKKVFRKSIGLILR